MCIEIRHAKMTRVRMTESQTQPTTDNTKYNVRIYRQTDHSSHYGNAGDRPGGIRDPAPDG